MNVNIELRHRRLLVTALTIGSAVSLPGYAQDNKNEKDTSGLWDVDEMMETAARNLARRYNLNDDQAAFTRDLLVRDVTKFLDANEDTIWPLFRELMGFQLSGKLPGPDRAKGLGAAALPLIASAKQAILNGNAEWRACLTEDQKRMHDYDLREMEKNFKTIEGNFQKWKAGRPVNAPIFPPARQDPNEPRRPLRPAPGSAGYPTSGRLVAVSPDLFEVHVRKFIADYRLDDSQTETALSILRECKERAEAYRLANQEAFAKAQKESKEARRSKDLKRIRTAAARFRELNDPITELFAELKQRLEAIPSEAQREQHAEARRSQKSPRRAAAQASPKRSASDPVSSEKNTSDSQSR